MGTEGQSARGDRAASRALDGRGSKRCVSRARSVGIAGQKRAAISVGLRTEP